MGKGTDPRTYYPCLKCGKAIPHYAIEIHTFECHDREQAVLSHSYVEDLLLHAYVRIIGQAEKDEHSGKKNVRKKKELSTSKGNKKEASFGGNADTIFLQQPEWLKKIAVFFHHRIVFINGSDMIRCKMKSYAPVILCHMEKKCAFLAVPWNAVRIAHIILYDEGIKKWIPGVKENSLLSVQAIPIVRIASKILLELSPQYTMESLPTIKRQLHETLYCASPQGSPFTLTPGCHLPVVNLGYISYMAVIKDVSFLEEPDNVGFEHKPSSLERTSEYTLTSCTNVSYPSSLMTVDESGGSDSIMSLTEKIGIMSMDDNESILGDVVSKDSEGKLSQLYSVFDRYDLDDSHDDVNKPKAKLVISTPKKNSQQSVENLRKTLLTSSFMNHSAVGAEQIQKNNIWFRIDKNTDIDVISEEQIMKEVAEEKPKYLRDATFYEMLKIMESKLNQYKSKDEGTCESWTGVLLHGPSGTGKTLLVQEVAKAMQIPLITLSVAHITSTSVARSDSIKQQFKKALDCAPSILFLDELDSLCPASERSSKNENNILPHLLKGIHKIQISLDPVLLVAASSRPEGIAPKLCQAGRLDKELLISLLAPRQRLLILQSLLKSCYHEIDEEGQLYIAKKSHGYSGADLAMLVKCAWVSCLQRSKAEQNIKRDCKGNVKLTLEDMEKALSNVIATVLKENMTTQSKVQWSDICGYSSLKTWLKNMIDCHIDNPEENPLKGLLLYGPPGCSKTLFVKALVYQSGFSFFPVKCSDLLSKYVGETEKSLRKLFLQAQQAAPAIIFLDEVDSLCEERCSGGSGSLLSEFLSLASYICSTGNIALIGATNRPHALDEAVMCPTCFAQVVHIDLPDTECRREMWMQLLCDVPTEENLNIAALVSASEGYSGAEIVAVYQEAAQSIIFALDNCKEMEGTLPCSKLENQSYREEKAKLSINDFDFAFQKIVNRTPASLLKNIEDFIKQRHVLVFR